MTKPYPAYEGIGIRDGDEYRQLATSLLQIENEFYGTIRPKRVIRAGERPLHALRERGVEYVEVRLMDLDPFVPIAISLATVRFLDVFLLHCLLCDSPPDTPEELVDITGNKQRVASRGREPGLRLTRQGREVELVEWGAEVLADCAPVAAALDRAQGGSAHDSGPRRRGRSTPRSPSRRRRPASCRRWRVAVIPTSASSLPSRARIGKPFLGCRWHPKLRTALRAWPTNRPRSSAGSKPPTQSHLRHTGSSTCPRCG